MNELKRVTGPTVDVLRVLRSTEDAMWGLRVMRETGLAPGTVYPILDRLEQAGWVASHWEVDDRRAGPRRRFYELTADGAAAAQRAVARFDARLTRTSRRVAGAHQ